MKADRTMNPYFYITGCILIGIVTVYAIFESIFHFHLIEKVPPCVFYTVTGLYCPGCGGTRASFALLRGNPLRSFYYHPFVLYVAIVGGWFMVSQTIERLSQGKVHIGMNFRSIYLWIGMIIIIVNFIVKNAILLATGTALLG